MKTITIGDIKGSQLPKEWGIKAEVNPDEVVEVTIGPPREKQVQELLELIGKMGQEAGKNRLTEQKLAKLLDGA